MRFAQIIQRALTQAGEDAADMEEYRQELAGYVNEGYHRIIREAYRPYRRVEIEVEEGALVSTATLRNALEIRSVTVNGRARNYAFRPYERALEVIGARSGDEAAILYTHDEADMTDSEEEPKLPEYVHGALADYATYRYLLNGNLNKQQRAQAYLQHFMMAMRSLKPYGELDGGVRNFRNLYRATRG